MKFKNGDSDVATLSRRSVMIAAAGMLALPTPGFADDWKKLGRRSVRLIGDHDIILVILLKGGFRKLKLKVRENGIHIENMTVVYSTCGNDNIPIRSLIAKGGESRVIDLRGGDRLIRSIQFTYRSIANSKGRAEVAVCGKD